MGLQMQSYGIQSMLKEGHKHLSGLDEAVIKNIDACKQLSAITRTSLGPNGIHFFTYLLFFRYQEKEGLRYSGLHIATTLLLITVLFLSFAFCARVRESLWLCDWPLLKSDRNRKELV